MTRLLTIIALLSLFASTAFGLGEESVGNEKITGANYEDWPGALAVINDEHRVYRFWVNGNEKFFFSGSTEALNKALVNFSKIKADKRVVVLRPAPATTHNFSGDHVFEYNWQLHLLGGIAKHMSTRDLGENIWDPHPYLHIHVGGKIKLDDIRIPEGVEVLEIADLQSRYAKSFDSTNQSVRGWACGELTQLNVYDDKSMQLVAKQLDDNEDWVKLNAAGSLAEFTHLAKEAIQKLEATKTDDKQVLDRISQSIETLKTAKPDKKEREAFEKSLQLIHAFVEKHRE